MVAVYRVSLSLLLFGASLTLCKISGTDSHAFTAQPSAVRPARSYYLAKLRADRSERAWTTSTTSAAPVPVSAITSAPPPRSTTTSTAAPPVTVGASTEGGWKRSKASFYGATGNNTADGSYYDGSSMTFAHKTMAFGTKVTFRYNGKTVTGVCNDRGPYVAGREFDLSRAMFEKLSATSSGVIDVEWKVV